MLKPQSQRTLKQRITLYLGAACAVLVAMAAMDFYQSGVVLGEMDRLMGNFNAISHFQGGVERGLSALEDYRWEFGDEDDLLAELRAATNTTNAWLDSIDGEIDTTSEEQNLLCQAVRTITE